MKVNISTLQTIYSSDGITDFLYGYLQSYYNEQENDHDSIVFSTLSELSFIVKHKKKFIIDLEKIEEYDSELFEKVYNDILSKFIFKDNDIGMTDDELLDSFENEKAEDFDTIEKLDVLNSNDELLYNSSYALSLSLYGFIKVSKKKVTITDKIIDSESYKYFVENSIEMVIDDGQEYNIPVYDFLINNNIISE